MKSIPLYAAFLICMSSAVQAADTPPPAGVLNLTSSASVEVTKDVLGVSFSTTRDGTDAASVQSALKQALDAALVEARKVARPGAVEVQAGNFSLYPRYTAKGVINGWQGSAEMSVEGKDMTAIAQLSGRITTMTIARVGYSLSKETRQRAGADITAQAIQGFKAKADDYAKQFGYSGASVREVSVASNEPQTYAAAPMMARAMKASADEALPVEPGKGTVTVMVNGSVQMK